MIGIAICDDERYFSHILENMIAAYMAQREMEYSLDMFGSGNEFVDYCAAEHELTVS